MDDFNQKVRIIFYFRIYDSYYYLKKEIKQVLIIDGLKVIVYILYIIVLNIRI